MDEKRLKRGSFCDHQSKGNLIAIYCKR